MQWLKRKNGLLNATPLFFEKKEVKRWKCWEYVLGVAVDHKIIINGKVQMVGFRTFIKNSADSFDIKGFAENLPDGTVKIVCEGEKAKITDFISYIKQESPSFAAIDDKQDKTIGILKDVKEDTKYIPGIKDDTSKMLGKQDKAMEILDCVKQEIKVKLEAG